MIKVREIFISWKGMMACDVSPVAMFFLGIWFFDTQDTFYLMAIRIKNAFFMHFLSLPLGIYNHNPMSNRPKQSKFWGLGHRNHPHHIVQAREAWSQNGTQTLPTQVDNISSISSNGRQLFTGTLSKNIFLDSPEKT